MVEVIWTDSALQDLDDIGEYISRDSERYAEITVELLFSSVNMLHTKHLSFLFLIPYSCSINCLGVGNVLVVMFFP